jgi:penicillin-binding protein 1C
MQLTTFKRLRLRKISWIFLIPFVLVVGFFINDAVNPVNLNPKQGSQIVLAEDGTLMRAFSDEQGIWRYPTTLNEVSPLYIEALIHYEDRYFYSHPGVNPLSLTRALLQAINQGNIVSGGSTLTMQVARLRYPERRNITGKLKEIVRALQLEIHFSKEEILTYYINHAPFGGTIEGVQAAALTYLGYGAQDLTHAQAALLAVLPQAPTRYRPDRNAPAAQRARDKVIDRLIRFNIWTEQIGGDAKQEIVSNKRQEKFQLAPLLARRLARENSERVITTTIHAGWQYNTESIVKEYVQYIESQVSAAVLILDNKTGQIKTYVGSADFADDQRFGHVDMIQAIRSPGSTLKPFIYGEAIDDGLIHSESLLMNVPLRFGDYQPENFSGGFTGAVSVSHALATSLNVPAVQVLDRLGPIPFYLSLRAAGAELKLPTGEKPNLAIALGGIGTNLESLVTLMSSLDNLGRSILPTYSRVQSPKNKPLLSEGSAWIIRNILSTSPNAPMGLALKTGTSYGYRDSWAIAVADGYTFGVWVGKPDGTPLTGHFGRQTAVPLLTQIASMVISKNPHPPQPNSVTTAEICWPTGKSETANLCDEPKTTWLLNQQQPSTWMNIKSDTVSLTTAKTQVRLATDSLQQVPFGCDLPSMTQERVLWPSPLQLWIPSEFRHKQRLPLYDQRCDPTLTTPPQLPLKITGIRSGDAIIASDVSNGELTLIAEGGQAPFFWYINGQLRDENTSKLILPTLGEHHYEIVLMDYHGQIDREIIDSYF